MRPPSCPHFAKRGRCLHGEACFLSHEDRCNSISPGIETISKAVGMENCKRNESFGVSTGLTLNPELQGKRSILSGFLTHEFFKDKAKPHQPQSGQEHQSQEYGSAGMRPANLVAGGAAPGSLIAARMESFQSSNSTFVCEPVMANQDEPPRQAMMFGKSGRVGVFRRWLLDHVIPHVETKRRRRANHDRSITQKRESSPAALPSGNADTRTSPRSHDPLAAQLRRRNFSLLDVAGGKGELSFELSQLNGIDCVLADPRASDVAKYSEKLARGGYHCNPSLLDYVSVPIMDALNTHTTMTEKDDVTRHIDGADAQSPRPTSSSTHSNERSPNLHLHLRAENLTRINNTMTMALSNRNDNDISTSTKRDEIFLPGRLQHAKLYFDHPLLQKFLFEPDRSSRRKFLVSAKRRVEEDVLIGESTKVQQYKKLRGGRLVKVVNKDDAVVPADEDQHQRGVAGRHRNDEHDSTPTRVPGSAPVKHHGAQSNSGVLRLVLSSPHIDQHMTQRGSLRKDEGVAEDAASTASTATSARSRSRSRGEHIAPAALSRSASRSSSSSSPRHHKIDVESSAPAAAANPHLSKHIKYTEEYVEGAQVEQYQTRDESDLLLEAFQNFDLVIGMHVDGAAEAMIDYALAANKAFALVPCCTCSKLFPNRRHPRTGKLIKSYVDLIEYLLAKNDEIRVSCIDFEGKNLVLWKL
ncbi:unnamed protein product [Amoebophrya sp. A25]|nr:unnamed protein product [Amoebophrya sp. A25]|eukprot:GSA25T00015769001.1